ncbi:bacillithiol system redox-active protein YtxJ [Oceanobacillus sojae]|uniref:bacillithiol system redox-active protein YtxJ n=1 Tax=Oceanobacillus sojae TaxID=582851 RepID=UPI0009887EDA|nr:bacillithiol system redox-active protein YtxJ [Oceanobacillus sojae]MCT1904618.1 bacillithiol system redox-active protein YtxJ [Oceanobacillus sojae]
MKQMDELTTLAQWNEIWNRSMDTPIIIFKHSTSCMISARAWKHVKTLPAADKAAYYLVKVIENRDVSNQIAEDTSVTHKSPQIFLIHQLQVIWHTSHWKITKSNIEKEVSRLG